MSKLPPARQQLLDAQRAWRAEKRKRTQPPALQQLADATADVAPVLAAWLSILAPDLPRAEREFLFDQARLWRFDLCWPEHKLAAEVDGGRHAAAGGKHASDADYAKLNSAVVQGWRVLRFTTSQVARDPAYCVEQIDRALKGAT